MKKIIVYTMMCVVTVWLVACTVCKPVKKPANLKPLSKTEYNDVYTVYYNCNQNCSEYPNQYEGDTVMVCGWRTQTDLFSIADDTVKRFPEIYVDNIYVQDEYIRKKIYITGTIKNDCVSGAPTCFLHIIAIDVYVEE